MVLEVNMPKSIKRVNIIKIDTDIMKFFPDTKSVNEELQT